MRRVKPNGYFVRSSGLVPTAASSAATLGDSLLVAQPNAQYAFVRLRVTAKPKFEADRIKYKMIKFPREAEPPRRKRYKILVPAVSDACDPSFRAEQMSLVKEQRGEGVRDFLFSRR